MARGDGLGVEGGRSPKFAVRLQRCGGEAGGRQRGEARGRRCRWGERGERRRRRRGRGAGPGRVGLSRAGMSRAAPRGLRSSSPGPAPLRPLRGKVGRAPCIGVTAGPGGGPRWAAGTGLGKRSGRGNLFWKAAGRSGKRRGAGRWAGGSAARPRCTAGGENSAPNAGGGTLGSAGAAEGPEREGMPRGAGGQQGTECGRAAVQGRGRSGGCTFPKLPL